MENEQRNDKKRPTYDLVTSILLLLLQSYHLFSIAMLSDLGAAGRAFLRNEMVNEREESATIQRTSKNTKSHTTQHLPHFHDDSVTLFELFLVRSEIFLQLNVFLTFLHQL